MAKKQTKTVVELTAVDSPDGKPVIAFPTPAIFDRWLSKHHTEHGGVWIQFFKKDSGHKSITYAQALDIALCHGWIDGLVRKGNAVSWSHKFTPRGKRSVWSQVNQAHIERLTRAGQQVLCNAHESESLCVLLPTSQCKEARDKGT